MASSHHEEFHRVYVQRLTEAVQNHPDEYAWPVENVPQVAEKMMGAIVRGTFNKDGYAIRNTCKQLDIPYTYAGIRAYLTQDESGISNA